MSHSTVQQRGTMPFPALLGEHIHQPSHVKALTFFSLVFASAAATAGSSPPPPSPVSSGLVSFDDYPRALTFEPGRVWQDQAGVIMVCPSWRANVDGGNRCMANTKDGKDGWNDVRSIAISGFELAAYQFVFSGTSAYKSLVLYYRASKPIAAAMPVAAPAAGKSK